MNDTSMPVGIPPSQPSISDLQSADRPLIQTDDVSSLPDGKHSLSTDPILRLETTDGAVPGAVPDALAKLCDGSLLDFDGLAAHQRHPWNLFLYQTAALALIRSGEAEAAEDDAAWRALADPSAWRDRLAALTPGCADTAWSLVCDDPAKPAFMQPPLGAAGLAGYAIAGRTPDEIDLLVTAKNHDVKAARAGRPEARHWCFALVTTQTLNGYSGRGNFGIARMNGGFASRPMVMRTPGQDAATCFRRGVQAALGARAKALDRHHALFAGRDGTGLLWLEPWEREEAIPMRRLDPLFVEVCRRLRLARDKEGRIVAWGKPSTTARVDANKALKGDFGDAWTPLAAEDGTALTVGGGGFDYRLVSRLLDPTAFTLPIAAQPRRDDPREMVWLHCAVLVRGQGKTEGLHERWVRLPGRSSRETLGKLSNGMVAQAKDAKGALRRSLLTFLQGAPAKWNLDDRRADAVTASFEQETDRVFFDHLFERASVMDTDTEEAAEIRWKQRLAGTARALFARGVATLSPPESRREKAQAVAASVLAGMLVKAGLAQPKDAETSDTMEEADAAVS